MAYNDSAMTIREAARWMASMAAAEQLYIIPNRMIRKDGIIHLDYYSKCHCPQTPDAFHDYICHYYSKRVFKKP